MLILWKSKTIISSMARSKPICLLFLLVCCVHTTLGSATGDASSDNDSSPHTRQERLDAIIALFPESYKDKAQEIALKLFDAGITSPEYLDLLDTIQPKDLDMLKPKEAQTLLDELKNKDPKKDPAPNDELAKIEEEVSQVLNGSSKSTAVALYLWKDGVKTLDDFIFVDLYTAKDFPMLVRIQAKKMIMKLMKRAVARQEIKSSTTTPKPSTPVPETSKASTPVPKTSKASTPVPKTTKASTPVPKTSKASTPVPKTSKASTPVPNTSKASTPVPKTSKASTPVPKTSTASTPISTTPKPSKASTPVPTASGPNNTNTTKRGNDASSNNNSTTTTIAAVKDHSHDGEQHFDADNNKTPGSARLIVFILFAILMVAVFYMGYSNRTKIQAWVMDMKKSTTRPSSKNYKRVAEDVEGGRVQAKTDATYNYIY